MNAAERRRRLLSLALQLLEKDGSFSSQDFRRLAKEQLGKALEAGVDRYISSLRLLQAPHPARSNCTIFAVSKAHLKARLAQEEADLTERRRLAKERERQRERERSWHRQQRRRQAQEEGGFSWQRTNWRPGLSYQQAVIVVKNSGGPGIKKPAAPFWWAR